MKIGIELNNIVRDINGQILKYFKKDIKKDYDDKNVDLNVLNISETLPFKSDKARKTFLYIDYPYEIFGCAKNMHRNLQVRLTDWIDSLNNRDEEQCELTHFSLKEDALTIQSTYYFLSKTGTRVREMYFPKDGKDMWNICDVLITTDERIVKTKPSNKVVVLIKKNDNSELIKHADLVYDNLLDLMDDTDFYDKVQNIRYQKSSLWNKVVYTVKHIF